jgi:hypothetical protein
LVYVATVPEHVKGTVTLFGKSPELDRTEDYRGLYLQWHSAGWHECLERFLDSTSRSAATFLRDFPQFDLTNLTEPQGPILKQYTAYEQDAEKAGFDQCLLGLRTLAERYGQEPVRQALRQQYKSELKLVE